MPSAPTLTEWIILGILVLVLLVLISVRAALSRLEAGLSRLHKGMEQKAKHVADATDSQAHESAFEQFLAEDPGRLGMSKSEQFAAYRQWRKDRGMNWSSASGE